MRDRLIDIIKKTVVPYFAEFIADDLIADGWIRPPCKVGDAVWVIRKFGGNKLIDCGTVSEVIITDKPQIKVKRVGKGTIANGEFGKTVFLTVEEAEQALTCQENRQVEEGGVQE